MQPFFKIDIFSVDVDFHIFANPDTADFRHAEMTHRIADRISLRVEDCFLRFDDYVNFHVSHANADLPRNKRFAGANFAAGGHELLRVGLGKPTARFW